MSMVFCRGCGKEIHDSAAMCPHCGAVQTTASVAPETLSNGIPWMAIVSLALGVFCILMLLDDSVVDKETIIGFGIFPTIGLALGIVSFNSSRPGKNIAVGGIVLSTIAFIMVVLAVIGLSIQ